VLEELSLESLRRNDQSQSGDQVETGSQVSDLFHPERLAPQMPTVDAREQVPDGIDIPPRPGILSDQDQRGDGESSQPPVRPSILSDQDQRGDAGSSQPPVRPSILSDQGEQPKNDGSGSGIVKDWFWHRPAARGNQSKTGLPNLSEPGLPKPTDFVAMRG
jgi:hypothetical protein